MFTLLKLILNFYSGEAKLPLIPKAGPSPNITKLFLGLSEWDDELLSTPKMITFLAMSLTKLHELDRSNAIPQLLYTCFSLSLFFRSYYTQTCLCYYVLLC